MEFERLIDTEVFSEDFLSLVYRYYELRGYKNIVLIKINNLITTLFLLFVIVFVTSFVNYSALFTSYKLENAIDFTRNIHPVLIVYMTMYLCYWCWKLAKTVYDLKKFNTIRVFYRDNIGIDDFKLQNTNWATVRDKLSNINSGQIDQAILRKGNYLLGTLRHILTFHNWISLSKIMEWEIGFIMTTFMFSDHGKYLRENINADELRKRLKIIGIINIFVIPFLIIFSGVYVVFHYGEIMYTKSRYITSREWSKWIRFMKIKRYDELPHDFEDRIFRAKKYADKYYSFFRPSLVYNFAQLFLTILGIVFAVFILFIILNFNFLIKFEIWGKSCFQYVSIVFTTMVMLKNYLNKYTRVVGSEEKTQRYLAAMMEILKITDQSLLNDPISKETFKEFSGKWYYSRVKIVLLELWGILCLPYIFIKTLPDFADSIINFLHDNTIRSDWGDYLVPEQLLVNTL